jgi:hypothetical protein
MRWKTIDSNTKDVLSMGGHIVDRNKNKSLGGRSKSSGQYLRKWRKFGKDENCKKDCKYKNVDKGKVFDEDPSTEGNISSK